MDSASTTKKKYLLRRILGVVIIVIDIYWVSRIGLAEAFGDVFQAITVVTLAVFGLILIAGTGE